MEGREDWGKAWLVARLWWCEDDDCDCSQPIIERIGPNFRAGYPWITRRRVWEGTFETDGEGRPAQITELQEASEKYGIALGDDNTGECVLTGDLAHA